MPEPLQPGDFAELGRMLKHIDFQKQEAAIELARADRTWKKHKNRLLRTIVAGSIFKKVAAHHYLFNIEHVNFRHHSDYLWRKYRNIIKRKELREAMKMED